MIGCGVLAMVLAGCDSMSATTPVSLTSSEADKVATAIARWPAAEPGGSPIKRPFFTTIHAAGRRTTASGVMQYYGPRDFRMIAATEMGAVLFDGRMNWAGVTVLRTLPGLDKSIVSMILTDMSHAFALPADLKGLSVGTDRIVLRKTMGDTYRYTWVFSPETGQLRTTDIDYGILDTLHVEYRAYNAAGWPEEMVVTRKARLLDISLSFTDDNVVQGAFHGNAQ